MSGLVSCILPVYNGAPHLRDAVDSILAQDHRELEVIAIDDGSGDESAQMLAAYGSALTVVTQPNAGPAAARNRGLALARGAFVAFLDQDDRWHPHKLSRQLAHLARDRRLDVSVAHVESFWAAATGTPPEPRVADQPRSGVVPGYVTGAMLARRRVFDRVGGFSQDCRYVDSLDWFARAAECGAVVALLPDVLLYHRVHAGNLSRHGHDSRAECLRVVRAALERRRAAGSLHGS
jgi:glycosyltransferase involved in cell wall biosynthesis